ncbi:hypothetical protein A8B78_02710 [Jannaschia sp. EhC01]|nr:hypothetical protein A8B78_02710 [Jannaschia sp. EhC01]
MRRPQRRALEMTAPIAIAARGVGVSFSGTSVLRGIDLDIHSGEIHGLIGENGAGKSTLGKVLGGYYQASEGQLTVFGQPVQKWGPPEALAQGIAIMHQELQLVPALSVAQNVFLGIEDKRFGVLRNTEAARLKILMNETGFQLNPNDTAGDLSIADRQKVEILRALARDARVIVMDEPTSSLAKDQITHLHEMMRRLRDAGRSVIYVSHFLDDVLDVADRITVLRDGNLVHTVEAAYQTKASMVAAMLGGEKSETPFPPKRPVEHPAPLLIVNNLRSSAGVHGVDINVGAGEIVGLIGLVGSGRTEIARAIIGADPASGKVMLEGEAYTNRSPAVSTQKGIVLVPEDRRKQGLVMTLPVSANATLPHLKRFAKGGMLNTGAERDKARALIEEFQVRPAVADGDISSFSGGNQQKVLIAKWLLDNPKLVILDEPSRGVDVGARQLIHEAIAALSARGVGVLVISSEIDEVIGLAHRAYLVDRGRIMDAIDTSTTSEADVLALLFKYQSDAHEDAAQ